MAKSTDGVHFSSPQKSHILNTQDSFALHSPQILYSPTDAKFVALSVGISSLITSGGHNDRDARSNLVVATSADGIKWTPLSQAVPSEHLPYFAHNLGVSHTPDGHLENVSLITIGAPFKPSATNGAGTWGQWNLYMDIAQIKVASSQEPVGNFEEILNDQAKGWIVDMDYSSYAVELHVYVGGEYAQGGTFYGSYTTDLLRPDVNSYFGISGQHGFMIPLDDSFKGQRIYIYAIDLNGNFNSLVGSVQY